MINLIERIPCSHCEEKGSCKIVDGHSCKTCLRDAKIKEAEAVVICSVCDGLGKVEPKTERLNARTPFVVVSLVLVVFYFYALVSLFNGQNFELVFPLISSLTTMIATFYFAKR